MKKTRNYRDMSEAEIRELERLYPVTVNRELSQMFNVSVDTIINHFARPRGWQKDMNAVRIGNRGGKSVEGADLQWFIDHFKNTKNEDIMSRLGIGESQLHRLARKYGLKKTPQFIKKTRQRAMELAQQVCRDYGIYEETAVRMRRTMLEYKAKGLPLPGGFKAGVSNRDRMGPERYKEMIAKARDSRNESIRKDRARIAFGLPQKLKIKLSLCDEKTMKRRTYLRYALRKRNYIVERGGMTIWYDEETDRYLKLEERAMAAGLKIESDMMDDATEVPAPKQEPVRVIHPPREYESW